MDQDSVSNGNAETSRISQNHSQAQALLESINTHWHPVDIATLLFLRRDQEVLLIRKKRGLGAGKINGPGGKIEPGETPAACAIREVAEELGVEARNPQPCGELRFLFLDGYSIHVHVFCSSEFSNEAVETDEALPLWTHVSEIPYEEMWADDIIWLPRVLNGEEVDGQFVFDGDQLLAHTARFAALNG